MSSKKEGSKIRILAIAYAQGRLDKDNYRRLRTSQLSAMDFNKASPDLPAELNDIEIPRIKVDPPRAAGKKRSLLSIISIILGIIVLLAVITAYLYKQGKAGRTAMLLIDAVKTELPHPAKEGFRQRRLS